MEHLFSVLLALHITGGSIGLLSGTLNLFRIKGDKTHKKAGRIFTYGMLTAGFSALFLSIIHPSYFLFIVGTFTIYLVGTGRRYIYLKMMGIGQKPSLVDWILTVMMLLNGSVFLLLGLKQIFMQHYFGIVLVVFGFFGLRLVKTDYENYSGKTRVKNFWLTSHLQRMTGGYIAALTAFLVVNSKNFPFEIPGFIAWLIPTLVLVPFIYKWSAKYGVKKQRKPE